MLARNLRLLALSLAMFAGSTLAELPVDPDLDLLEAPRTAAHLDTSAATATDSSTDATPLAPLPDALRERLQSGSAGEWSAQAGETLQQALQRWADNAGWQLIWAARAETNLVLDVDLDYPPGTTMPEAIRTTFKALSRRPAAPKACEYRNKTLRIVNLGDRCD